MSTLHIFQTIFELFLIFGLVWCFFHEDKFLAFEKNLLAKLRRRRLKVVGSAKQKIRTNA